MYMTGVAGNDPNAGMTVTNNNIYYSTSWITDGVNWSKPQLLLNGAWLPSTTVASNGDVLLYANSTANAELNQWNLGPSGVAPGNPKPVHYFDTSGKELGVFYANVDIAWMPQISLYQMLGQRGDQTQIDYLVSADGLNFVLEKPAIISTTDGVNSPVITPAHWPNTFCWVFYGHGSGELNFNIYYHSWC